MVTKQDIQTALERLGVKAGDTMIVHSSFKSLGPVENGADTIVSGMLETLGEDGTLLFPTLCQKDWEHVFENWTLDAPSDVGYLTNYFRKLPEAKRSNQATHSVAAIGRDAVWFTETHGETGRRHGIFGDTCFSADSPWEKMYERDTKVLFLGVGEQKCTLRHLAEYRFMDKCLKKAEQSPRYEELKSRVWCYDRWDDRGVWWHILSAYVRQLMEPKGQVHVTQCGDATLTLFNTRDFVDTATQVMETRDLNGFFVDNGGWNPQDTLDWLEEVDAL